MSSPEIQSFSEFSSSRPHRTLYGGSPNTKLAESRIKSLYSRSCSSSNSQESMLGSTHIQYISFLSTLNAALACSDKCTAVEGSVAVMAFVLVPTSSFVDNCKPPRVQLNSHCCCPLDARSPNPNFVYALSQMLVRKLRPLHLRADKCPIRVGQFYLLQLQLHQLQISFLVQLDDGCCRKRKTLESLPALNKISQALEHHQQRLPLGLVFFQL